LFSESNSPTVSTKVLVVISWLSTFMVAGIFLQTVTNVPGATRLVKLGKILSSSSKWKPCSSKKSPTVLAEV